MPTKIEWTEETWNPLIGCDKISAGCSECYAVNTAWIRMHNPKMKEKYAGTVYKTKGGKLNWTGQINMHEPSLVKPLKTRKPTTFFVNSMSDLFHADVPFEFILKVFAVAAVTPEHTYQICTKREVRAAEFFAWIRTQGEDWVGDKVCEIVQTLCDTYNIETGCGSWIEMTEWPLPNVWIGVSIEDDKTIEQRHSWLMECDAVVRFWSAEPLLSRLPASEIWARYGKPNWVICGGESGPGARPMHPDWARSLRDSCGLYDVPFFFKQWGEWFPYQEATHRHPVLTCDALENDIDKYTMRPTLYQNYYKVGKKNAGRLLDGVEHNAMPDPHSN